MMIKLFKQLMPVIVCCFLAMPAFAQNATSAKKSMGSTLAADRSKMLCKAWQLDTISEFGVDNKVTAKEASDGVTFVADGSFFITQEGVASTGTWTYSAGRINTHTTNTDVPDNKMSFKIISLADNRLVLEYQSPDLSKSQYTYSPKK
jgi:Lipocalin-like domain